MGSEGRLVDPATRKIVGGKDADGAVSVSGTYCLVGALT